MRCIKCEKPSLENKQYCKEHYIEYKNDQYLDNSDINNLGIIRWLKETYPEHYRNEFPKEHKEIYLMWLRLYDPRYVNKLQRNRLLIAFRSFAKSKIIFGIISYILTFNNKKTKVLTVDKTIMEFLIVEKFIVLFSETGSMAEDFVVNIRDEFTSNSILRYFNSFTIQNAIDAIDGQWTRKAFKLNNCYLLGLGAEQQSRGRVKGAYRPTAVFYDDIYSENNTTELGREKVKRWFRNSAQRTIDDILGKALLTGTIIHEDTVLIEAKESKGWQKYIYTPMPLEKFHKFIKKHLHIDTDRDICKLPYEDEPDEFKRIALQTSYFKEVEKQEDWGLIWEDRINLYYLALNYKEAVEGRDIPGFYQEYFHITVPSETKQFRRDYFQKIDNFEIFREFGYSWIKIDKEIYNLDIHFGVDIAGFKQTADNSVIVVVGAMSNNKYIVIDEIYGKFSMRDNVNTEGIRHKVGYIDELLRQYDKYVPTAIKIGFGGGSEEQIIQEIIRIFRINNLRCQIYPRAQTTSMGRKEDRIKNGLLPHYETYSVYHAKHIDLLETELEFLGKSRTDDVADATEVAFYNLKFPIPVSYSYFKNPNKINHKPFQNFQVYDIEDWRLHL